MALRIFAWFMIYVEHVLGGAHAISIVLVSEPGYRIC